MQKTTIMSTTTTTVMDPAAEMTEKVALVRPEIPTISWDEGDSDAAEVSDSSSESGDEETGNNEAARGLGIV